MSRDVLYDMPVSNHGARVRILAQEKGIDLDVRLPSEIGGLKSPEFIALNAQGKMPLLVTQEGFPIPESDTICRYLLDKHPDGPSLMPTDPLQRSLCEQVTRIHDIYISPIQACMYRAPGTIFSVYGTDRLAALKEVLRQLAAIEKAVNDYNAKYPQNKGSFLCGSALSLADASLFPTAQFIVYMLPKYFDMPVDSFMGPTLQAWYTHMSEAVPSGRDVGKQVHDALVKWSESGRWDPILAELKEQAAKSPADASV